jgi:hypothetical protein
MRNSSRNNVVVERKKSENGGEHEAAIASSSVPGRRVAGTAELVGSHRRAVKAETPPPRDGAMRRSAMGRASNDIGQQIGRELRGLYADVVSQPVPDRFLDLLNRLETGAIPSSAGTKAPAKR